MDESLPTLQDEVLATESVETETGEELLFESETPTPEEEAAPVVESPVPAPDPDALAGPSEPSSEDPTPAVPAPSDEMALDKALRIGATSEGEASRPLSVGKIAGWTLLVVVLTLFVFWVSIVVGAFLRKQKFLEAGQDDSPSSDERLLSELTTLQVSLLRGEAASYYEKAFCILRRILKSRKLIDDLQADGTHIVESLKTSGVDPTYMDCVESILHRCEGVFFRGEKPDSAAHAKIEKDLRTLVRMRPHGSPFGRSKEKEAAPKE